MQQLFTAFSCLLAVASAYWGHSSVGSLGRGGSVVSKREASEETAPSTTPQDLYQLINETLVDAAGGIGTEELANRAEAIEILAEAIQETNQVNVSHDDVRNLVNDLADQLGIQISLADILFDSSLTEAANQLAAVFRLLQRLREVGISLEAAGQSSDVIVEAIDALAEVLKRVVTKIEGIVKFEAAYNQEDDVTRRGVEKGKRAHWDVKGGYSKENGWEGSVSVSWDG